MRRIATALAAAGLLLLAVASPAFAHVVISPPSAPKGSDALLTFVVANEEENASTTKIEVTFPQDHPIAEALTTPMTGWTAKVTTKSVTTPIETDEGAINEAVNTVTWTATAGGFGEGQFGTFPVSVGLPDADSLEFKVVQTYSNGDTVDWVDATVPGGDEPEHPAPVLTLTAGGETTATTAPASSTSSDDDSNGLAIAALIVGGIGVIIAIVALVMGGRRKSSASAV